MYKSILNILSTAFLILFSSLTLHANTHDAEIFNYIYNDDFSNITKWINTTNNIDVVEYSFLNTPLIEVSYKLGNYGNKNYLKIAELLLKKGANPNRYNLFKSNAITVAVKSHHSAIFLEMAHKFNANFSIRFNANNGTLLHAAAENTNDQNASITQFLLDQKIDPNSKTNGWTTPLMLAMSSNCKHYEGCGFMRETIHQLVWAGANVNAEDKYYGFTPLIYGIFSVNESYTEDLSDIEFILLHNAIVTTEEIKLAQSPPLKNLLKRYLK